MKHLFFFSVLFFSLSACKTPKTAIVENSVLSIKHGTSFGHCRGYCTKEKVFTNTSKTSLEISRDEKKEPTRSSTSTFTEVQFKALIDLIDFEKWNALEERIGCPDCADGGAEYIEITTSTGSKRVTFEYGETVESIQPLINQLRKESEASQPIKVKTEKKEVNE